MNKAKHFDKKASTYVVEHINGGGVFYSEREGILRKHPQVFMKCRRLYITAMYFTKAYVMIAKFTK